MNALKSVTAQRNRINLRLLDVGIAAGLMGLAVVLGSKARVGTGDVIALAGGAATVAIRRLYPAVASAAAIASLAAVQRLTTGTSEPAAVALLLDFYLLGRRCDARLRGATAAALLIAPVVLLIVGPHGSSEFDVTTSWAFACALPFAAGRAVLYHDGITGSLGTRVDKLAEDQDEQVASVAGQERVRVARELHDVVAHNVSVMVIQAVAARCVARRDRDAARTALDTVETCGREAMHEMRHLVGALHRDEFEESTIRAPGMAEMQLLAARAEAAGLPVTLRIEGRPRPVPPEIEFAAYRVAQEALTNSIRHAGPATATVKIRYTATLLELDITDTGRGTEGNPPVRAGSGGLIGMTERVVSHGGQLMVGDRPGGGFSVRAQFPLAETSAAVAPSATSPRRLALGPSESRQRVFDVAVALTLFALCQVQLLVTWHHHGSVIADTALLAGITIPVIWRRVVPLAAAAAVMGVLVLIAASPLNAISPDGLLFVLFIPPYSIGAYAPKRWSLAGLGICVGAWLALIPLSSIGPASWQIFSSGLIVASWGTGQLIKRRRMSAQRLSRSVQMITAESGHRTRLAVADERSRIARQLQAAVAKSVSDMVVQSHTARALLDSDADAADSAMAEIERTGQQALDEMRGVLGVLRKPDDKAELAPQPGIGQLHDLISEARRSGCDIELRVEGEPRPVPAVSHLALYRIAEDALASLVTAGMADPPGATLIVAFTAIDVSFELSVSGQCEVEWPTPGMCERASLCGGTISLEAEPSGLFRLRAILPGRPEDVFT